MTETPDPRRFPRFTRPIGHVSEWNPETSLARWVESILLPARFDGLLDQKVGARDPPALALSYLLLRPRLVEEIENHYRDDSILIRNVRERDSEDTVVRERDSEDTVLGEPGRPDGKGRRPWHTGHSQVGRSPPSGGVPDRSGEGMTADVSGPWPTPRTLSVTWFTAQSGISAARTDLDATRRSPEGLTAGEAASDIVERTVIRLGQGMYQLLETDDRQRRNSLHGVPRTTTELGVRGSSRISTRVEPPVRRRDTPADDETRRAGAPAGQEPVTIERGLPRSQGPPIHRFTTALMGRWPTVASGPSGDQGVLDAVTVIDGMASPESGDRIPASGGGTATAFPHVPLRTNRWPDGTDDATDDSNALDSVATTGEDAGAESRDRQTPSDSVTSSNLARDPDSVDRLTASAGEALPVLRGPDSVSIIDGMAAAEDGEPPSEGNRLDHRAELTPDPGPELTLHRERTEGVPGVGGTARTPDDQVERMTNGPLRNGPPGRGRGEHDQAPDASLPSLEQVVDIDRFVDRLYRGLERKARIERERRGR